MPGPSPTKGEIVKWYATAKKSLELRAIGKHPTRVKLSESDLLAYGRSVEDHFLKLKKAFNANLKKVL